MFEIDCSGNLDDSSKLEFSQIIVRYKVIEGITFNLCHQVNLAKPCQLNKIIPKYLLWKNYSENGLNNIQFFKLDIKSLIKSYN